jgi:hypothetical protein
MIFSVYSGVPGIMVQSSEDVVAAHTNIWVTHSPSGMAIRRSFPHAGSWEAQERVRSHMQEFVRDACRQIGEELSRGEDRDF